MEKIETPTLPGSAFASLQRGSWMPLLPIGFLWRLPRGPNVEGVMMDVRDACPVLNFR